MSLKHREAAINTFLVYPVKLLSCTKNLKDTFLGYPVKLVSCTKNHEDTFFAYPVKLLSCTKNLEGDNFWTERLVKLVDWMALQNSFIWSHVHPKPWTHGSCHNSPSPLFNLSSSSAFQDIHFIWLEVLVQLSLSTAKLTTHSELLHNLFQLLQKSAKVPNACQSVNWAFMQLTADFTSTHILADMDSSVSFVHNSRGQLKCWCWCYVHLPPSLSLSLSPNFFTSF
jgi:hypothetical protein